MLEESIPAAWACLNSWFTPTLIFVFLNLMIATIAIASGVATKNPLPPSVLQRIKSINLYPYTTTLLPQEPSESGTDTPFHNTEDRHVQRTTSDTKPASGDMPLKLAKKLRKSASAKSAFMHFEEEDVVQVRPATVRQGKKEIVGDDEEVDSKADDFINKFNNQLKLQRIDSILRYNERLSRGTGH